MQKKLKKINNIDKEISREKIVMEITKNNFDKEVKSAELPVLLDFWATWCGPCRMIAGEVVKIAEKFDGKLIVGKVNVDEEPYLSEKFGIEVIPTLVYVENGNEIKRVSGYLTQDVIEKTFNLK